MADHCKRLSHNLCPGDSPGFEVSCSHGERVCVCVCVCVGGRGVSFVKSYFSQRLRVVTLGQLFGLAGES